MGGSKRGCHGCVGRWPCSDSQPAGDRTSLSDFTDTARAAQRVQKKRGLRELSTGTQANLPAECKALRCKTHSCRYQPACRVTWKDGGTHVPLEQPLQCTHRVTEEHSRTLFHFLSNRYENAATIDCPEPTPPSAVRGRRPICKAAKKHMPEWGASASTPISQLLAGRGWDREAAPQ